MASAEWTVPVDAAGSWPCEHTDRQGQPAPPTRLSMDAAPLWQSADRTARNACGLLQCPDCGTYWRVWEHLRIAKAYAAYPHSRSDVAASLPPVPHYRRAPVRDIDRVIEVAGRQVPDLVVTQYDYIWPGDDEGIWFFWVPGLDTDIQLESSSGGCPFLVETDEQSSYGARTAATVEQAVMMVMACLKPPLSKAR